MAITGLSHEQFQKILRENLTPSAHVTTPERLFGREKALRQIDRALQSQGRQIFIYGDRGVGKSSVALTAAYLHNDSSHEPIYVICGETDTFWTVVQSIGKKVIEIEKRFETPAKASGFGGTVLGIGGNYQPATPGSAEIPLPTTINDALDIIRYVSSKRSGNLIIIIDEMERLVNTQERARFAEFIKNIPELETRVKFIFSGIGTTVSELIGAHQSAGRILETIELEKLHHDALWKIIEGVATKLNVEVDREKLIRIGQLSDGFPHYVHLLGECLFWNVFDDPEPVTKVGIEHFKEAVKGALERAEPNLKYTYRRATEKTRNTDDYQEALWALADTSSDRRQLLEIYNASYTPLMMKRTGRNPLARETFNQRLLSLKKESHGSVVIGYGSGWFGFRENILRGYVRLVAERNGINLGRQ